MCRAGAAALRCCKVEAPRPPKARLLRRPPRRGAPVCKRPQQHAGASVAPPGQHGCPKAQWAGRLGLRRVGVEGDPVRRCCQTTDHAARRRRAGGATTGKPARPRVRICGKPGATHGAAPGSSLPAPRAPATPVALFPLRAPRQLLDRPGRAGGNCAWAAQLQGGTWAAPAPRQHRPLRRWPWANPRPRVHRRCARGRAGSTATPN